MIILKAVLTRIRPIFFKLVDFIGRSIFRLLEIVGLGPEKVGFSKDKIKRILVIRTGGIKDIICSLPALTALRQAFPHSHIVLLSIAYTKGLTAELKQINESIIYDKKCPLSDKIKFLIDVKRGGFDLAVILTPYFTSAFLGFLSGAKYRIGHPANGSGFLLTIQADSKSLFKHEIETCLDVVRLIGVDIEDKRPVLPLSTASIDYIKDFLFKRGINGSGLIIGIHPGASSDYKRWNAEGFARVIDSLISRHNIMVVLIGGEHDEQIIDQILSTVKVKPVVLMGHNLKQLSAMIARCDIFLGNNSGPTHIASAVGIPAVAIFGSVNPLNNEDKWAPYGCNNIIVRKKMDCIGCEPGYCKRYRCLDEITPQDVLGAIEQVITRLNKA